MGECYADPLRFVEIAYPWGQPGPLEKETGPDDHQREFLKALGEQVRLRRFNGADPVMPIRMAIASGHGTGKSAMWAWICDWELSTRPHSIGTVTAGTATQLDARTWAAIEYWTKLCITSHWFEIMASGIQHKKYPETWKVVPQTCKEENAQSFAGQHARTSTSWYCFDEGSAVPDKIWTVAWGGMTDGEPHFFCGGQPERNTGMFHDVCFGEESKRWITRTWDGRTSRFTNKGLIEEWIRDYGEDSDWCRVRILGKPPSASELQFIDRERILQAQKRPLRGVLPDEPLVVGVDVSGGGAAWNVIYFRRGLDGRSIPRVRIPGEAIRHDRGVLVGKLAEILANVRPDKRVSAVFIDSAFGAPIAERLHALGYGKLVHEVNFGGESPDQHQANMRAYMWNRTKDWLLQGSLPEDREMPEKDKLAYQLGLPGYHLARGNNKLVIESKADLMKRGEKSPDDADALALTFARPVAIPKPKVNHQQYAHAGPWS